MKAGEALIFDTRMLHTTQPNITDQDRITLFINLVPTGTEPRLFFWNPENPLQLEAYDVDCEFIFDLDATQYPDEAQRAKGKFVERIDYNPVLWTKEDLQQRIPELSRNARAVAADSVSKPVVSAPVPVPVPAPVPARPVPAVVSPAPIGFLQRLSKIFSVG
jgi:hypothetical protein